MLDNTLISSIHQSRIGTEHRELAHQSSFTMVKQLQLWTQGQCAFMTGLDEIQHKWSQLLLMSCIAMVGFCDYVQLMVWDVCREQQGVFHRDHFVFRTMNREEFPRSMPNHMYYTLTLLMGITREPMMQYSTSKIQLTHNMTILLRKLSNIQLIQRLVISLRFI